MSAGKPSAAHTVVTYLMDLLVVVAVAALCHVVITFFGAASSASWGASILRLTRLLILPLGFHGIATQYGGVFDVNASLTVLILVAVEWVLGLARRNV